MIEGSTRPYILIYTKEINVGNLLLYLAIKNYGQTATQIDDISFRLSLMECNNIPTKKEYLKNLKELYLCTIPIKNMLIGLRKETRICSGKNKVYY